MNDKEINDFTKTVIKEAGLESPSSDFIKNVMREINVESAQKVDFTYKPLISKTGWFVVISLFVLGITGVYLNGSTTSIFSGIDVSFFKELNFSFKLPDFKFSKIFTFSVVFLAIIASFQILIIQRIYLKNSKD